jgi:hypothetical protein
MFVCNATRRRASANAAAGAAAAAPPAPRQLCVRAFWGVDTTFIETGIFSSKKRQRTGSSRIGKKPQRASSSSSSSSSSSMTTSSTSTMSAASLECVGTLLEGLTAASHVASPAMLAAATLAAATTTAGRKDGSDGDPAALDDEQYQFSIELPLTDEYFPAVFVVSNAPESSDAEIVAGSASAVDTAAALVYIVNGTKEEKMDERVAQDVLETFKRSGTSTTTTTSFELSCVAKIAVSSDTGKRYALQPVFGLEREETTAGEGGGEISNCIVCMDRPRNALFLPCRHIVVCDECAARVHVCPVCKLKYTSLVRLESTSWDVFTA